MEYLQSLQEYLHIDYLDDTVSVIFILVISLLSRPIISKIFLGWIRKLVEKSKNKVDDHILNVMETPIRFISIVVALYLIAEIYVPALQGVFIRTLIAFVIFWLLYNATVPLQDIIEHKEKNTKKSLINWALKIVRVMIIFTGASAILEIWGINVGAILAGLGILGAAVALGTQDLFKNLIAGFLILSERRFNEGEWIRVGDVAEGTVEKIGLRSTLLRRFDQAPMYVPNSQLADAPLINFTRMKHRRIHWSIGLEYKTTKAQLQKVVEGIEKLISSKDFVPANKISTFVAVDKFNDSSIDILVYAFTNTNDWGQWLKIKEKLALDVKKLVEDTGTGFAFPSQSIYIEKSGDVFKK
ncbi:MAG: mechanosensitive ion channel family protein [Alphaproteobacteria bacterium]